MLKKYTTTDIWSNLYLVDESMYDEYIDTNLNFGMTKIDLFFSNFMYYFC